MDGKYQIRYAICKSTVTLCKQQNNIQLNLLRSVTLEESLDSTKNRLSRKSNGVRQPLTRRRHLNDLILFSKLSSPRITKAEPRISHPSTPTPASPNQHRQIFAASCDPNKTQNS